MEGRALVAEALLAGAESTEVLGRLGDDVVVELEVDAAILDCWESKSSAVIRYSGVDCGGVDENKTAS